MSANDFEEALSTSKMVRDALRRSPIALDSLNSPPIFCYAPQTSEVQNLLRLMYAMSPLHSCQYAYQIPDEPNPMFIYCEHADRPVPQEFWDRLEALKALYLAVDTRHK